MEKVFDSSIIVSQIRERNNILADRPVSCLDLEGINANDLSKIFNISEEIAMDLEEDITFINSLIQCYTSETIPIEVKIEDMKLVSKFRDILNNIDEFFSDQNQTIPEDFRKILQQFYNLEELIRDRDWTITKNFKDEIRDLHPYIKRYLEDRSKFKSVSENVVGNG